MWSKRHFELQNQMTRMKQIIWLTEPWHQLNVQCKSASMRPVVCPLEVQSFNKTCCCPSLSLSTCNTCGTNNKFSSTRMTLCRIVAERITTATLEIKWWFQLASPTHWKIVLKDPTPSVRFTSMELSLTCWMHMPSIALTSVVSNGAICCFSHQELHTSHGWGENIRLSIWHSCIVLILILKTNRKTTKILGIGWGVGFKLKLWVQGYIAELTQIFSYQNSYINSKWDFICATQSGLFNAINIRNQLNITCWELCEIQLNTFTSAKDRGSSGLLLVSTLTLFPILSGTVMTVKRFAVLAVSV